MTHPVTSSGLLLVRPSVLATLARQAAAYDPDEMAGLLGADAAGTVVAAVPLARGTRDAVRVSAAAKAQARASLAARGLCCVGSYHSHPRTPAYPTSADRLAMGAGQVLVIVALRPAELRAFQLAPEGRGVRELAVRPAGEGEGP